jgi:hypothetical protein
MTLRSVIAFGLAAVLLISATAFGGARGQARVAGQMVLCQGGAVVTVSVDRDGQPVTVVHVCPDCALASLAALDLPDLAIMRPVLSRGALLHPMAQAVFAPQRHDRPSARGPPTLPA